MKFLNGSIIAFLCGLISGISLLITGNTLNFWLAKSGFSKEAIGLFSLVALPYSINFLWAPIFDKFSIPYFSTCFGIRQTWILFLCFIMSILVFALSFVNPINNAILFAILSCLISFFATSKDSVLGALRSELLTQKEQAFTSGIYVLGYRAGMLISGSGAILLSVYISWGDVYRILSLSCFIMPIILIWAINIRENSKKHIHESHNIINQDNGMVSFFKMRNIALILVFLVLYRLPDNFISIMLNAFMLDLQFNEVEIALYSKTLGTLGAIFGGLVAGFFLLRINVNEGLVRFGIIHIMAHMMLIIQAIYGKSIVIMSIGVLVESITGGMCMSAYIAFISSMCVGKYSATKYSVFSAVMGLSRTLLPSISGIIASKFGWISFFSICMLISIPPLLLVKYISKDNPQQD